MTAKPKRQPRWGGKGPDPEKSRARARKHYEANRHKWRERIASKQAVINAAKARPCADCGIQYPPYVMAFDHLPGHEKLDNVSQMARNRSLERIIAEIEKCEVVCHNCHAARTFHRNSQARVAGSAPPPR